MSELPKDAALRLARFIWPDAEWRKHRTHIGVYVCQATLSWFDIDSWDSIHTAEDLLIERGLGEEYGRALYAVMLSSVHGPVSLTDMKKYREDIAVFANAPREARARAMLKLEEEEREDAGRVER